MLDRPTELNNLLADYRSGLAMPRGFYASHEIYEYDVAAIWNRNWIWVGHQSQIPEPGDYFLFDYGPESIIVVRDREGEIRAHLNVCRHRGSRVCTEATGNARVFVCPYHAWTYDLSGRLRAGREMGPDFQPEKWGLFEARVTVFQGMIFVCADPATPALDDALSELAPLTAPFGLENLKVAYVATYPVPANWKLAFENYLECYHCGPAHQDYSKSHSLKSPKEMAALLEPMQERACEMGLPNTVLDLTGDAALSAHSAIYYRRYPLCEGYQTGSKTGAALAPLLGDLSGFDGG
ncbi:MAG: aromatic ring-hydroxylating oxygenase subunit alpha, partial [Rhizobiaceae bacterium]